MKPRVKHQQKWFRNRVGQFVVAGHANLFNPPIQIASEGHAKALWVSQSKGHRYEVV